MSEIELLEKGNQKYKKVIDEAREYMKDFIFEPLLVNEDRKLIMFNDNLRKFEDILREVDQMNEMYKYLQEHSYISENKKSNYQFELSKERAECIANKYNSLIEKIQQENSRYEKENKQLKEQLQQRDEVIEECIESIDNFMTHIDDSFCADMMIFIDILNKYKVDNK